MRQDESGGDFDKVGEENNDEKCNLHSRPYLVNGDKSIFTP